MLSDVFTVMDEEFRYWTGEAWHRDVRRAVKYPGPVDGWDRAEELARSLTAQGARCMVCYWPPRKRKVRKSTPRRDSRRA